MDRRNNDRKSRQNDDLDYLSQQEMRKHRRFGSRALEGTPVVLKPAPPFFGDPVDGKIVDLSGGGLAVLLPDAMPVNTKLVLWMVLPEREAITCKVSVRRVSPKSGKYLTGLQFLDLEDPAAAELARMSADYDACDIRIRHEETPVCLPACAFLSLCDKPQKQKN